MSHPARKPVCETSAAATSVAEPPVDALSPADRPIKVLVADDEPAIRSLLADVLREREDVRLETAACGREALNKVLSQEPDLLIADLKMPDLNGEDLTREALAVRPGLTVLIITGNGSLESAARLMREGVHDYLVKPLEMADFLKSLDRAVSRIRSRAAGAHGASVIGALLNAVEVRDPYLRSHSVRVAAKAYDLRLLLGGSAREAQITRTAALVHDVGKLGVPDAVLKKAGPLSFQDYAEIRKHPEYSAKILRPIAELAECLPEVYHHHEWYDGTGYPAGIGGDDIPKGARVLAICDASDAMASHRAYRPALPAEIIRQNLIAGSGSHFDPEVVEAFLELNKR